MKIIKISDRIIHIEFETIKEMTLTMFRFSEFSEGKKGIKGKKFTPDEFIDLYSDDEGNINYFAYWDGFNISISVIREFELLFPVGEISKRERRIIKALGDLKDGYLITTLKDDEITLKHELAHALWYENVEYRNECTEVISLIPKTVYKKFSDCLKAVDYIDEIVDTEINSYLVAYNNKDMLEIFPNIDFREYEKFMDMLITLYYKYGRFEN